MCMYIERGGDSVLLGNTLRFTITLLTFITKKVIIFSRWQTKPMFQHSSPAQTPKTICFPKSIISLEKKVGMILMDHKLIVFQSLRQT